MEAGIWSCETRKASQWGRFTTHGGGAVLGCDTRTCEACQAKRAEETVQRKVIQLLHASVRGSETTGCCADAAGIKLPPSFVFRFLFFTNPSLPLRPSFFLVSSSPSRRLSLSLSPDLYVP